MGGSAIISPNGEIMAQSASLEDELILAVADLDAGAYIKQNIFNFAAHRRPEHYRLIVETVGALRGPGAG
jgi:predicted amidohydrolase